ncbi:protein ALP1-like isoform X1 [Maniola jurtina]|uniref:uncharacterized protein n=1 Tax=Aphantopus hyperantus TaxID=2795564 RepID=UPI00156A3DAC|nr:protein ALP1-like [Maniola hyperantus]XP_034831184.1 protein ALP1-like [Maniola hyperantus]XP_034834833.1 protein ALP1-like [Maniola hyperantus]XP_034835281.1 protein ALP1-like [Maniola hyperantus]XP_034836386.1 protein ALP1-like [Maniola hyperantus]XP_034836469.1 protein ALP1-like [Maniola hyperantus]XP_034836641.1 protein ALP1-like [Maniola hyperantus]XP_034837923.1 protein ALP1-like [Maniola hyperantus]XP_034838336.1 protein ALP1-like [Maniola hyperantus]XP_034838802.1 protein ALP1-l
MLSRKEFRNCFKTVQLLLLEEVTDVVEEELKRKKRIWVRNWISERNVKGGSTMLLQQLKSEDAYEYRLAMRMTAENFEELLSLISNNIQRNDTLLRDAIPAKLKLEVTLSFLSTGNSYRSLSHLFRLPKSSISQIISEVCQEIKRALKDHIKVPSTPLEWGQIEKGFRNKWNFPLCYGAIDGKHIKITGSKEYGSVNFNYKKDNSIVLMALVDHDYCFTYINVGANGSASDGGIFKNCSIYNQLETSGFIPEGGVIVADAAFPLKTYMMKPYPGPNLSFEEKIFNYRLSRARRIVENAFGILANRFRVFEKAISTKIDTVDHIVFAACSLHNWLRKKSSAYLTTCSVDRDDIDTHSLIEGMWRTDVRGLNSITQQGSNHSSLSAREKRTQYTNYFVNEGKVPWQNNMIF